MNKTPFTFTKLSTIAHDTAQHLCISRDRETLLHTTKKNNYLLYSSTVQATEQIGKKFKRWEKTSNRVDPSKTSPETRSHAQRGCPGSKEKTFLRFGCHNSASIEAITFLFCFFFNLLTCITMYPPPAYLTFVYSKGKKQTESQTRQWARSSSPLHIASKKS